MYLKEFHFHFVYLFSYVEFMETRPHKLYCLRHSASCISKGITICLIVSYITWNLGGRVAPEYKAILNSLWCPGSFARSWVCWPITLTEARQWSQAFSSSEPIPSTYLLLFFFTMRVTKGYSSSITESTLTIFSSATILQCDTNADCRLADFCLRDFLSPLLECVSPSRSYLFLPKNLSRGE